MPDAPKKSSTPSVGAHRLLGLALVPLLIFALLGLLTYDWRDISWLQMPPNNPPANLIGQAGAWAAFMGYNLFGLAAWLVPVWLAVAATMLILNRAGELWIRTCWSVIFLLAFCALLQLAGGILEGTLEELNLDPNAGGAMGNWLMSRSLERWLSPVGGGLLALAVLLFTGVMAVGPARISALAKGTAETWRAWRQQRAEAAEKRAAARAEQDQLRAQQDESKAAERGFTGSSTRKTRTPEPGARTPEPGPPAPEEDRRIELRRRAEEARAAAKQAAEQAKEDSGSRPPDSGPRTPDPGSRTPDAGPRKSEIENRKSTTPPAANALSVNPPPPAFADYRLPDLSLLDPIPPGEAVHGDTAMMSKLLVDTLAQFNLLVEVTHVEPGPVVTRYELLPAAGIRVEKIATLAHTLQMVLKATSLRIQAPVPGKNVVGIEVPNPKARMVTLREILQGGAWATNKMEIPLALGKDVGGADMIFDLVGAPHLLVAGATGAGKSVSLNAILAGLLMSRRPDELKLLLVDPKRVEFPAYNNLPHLLVPVVTDAKKVAFALRWAIVEMDRRYKLLQAAKVRNIVGYNTRANAQQVELPLDGAAAGSEAALPAKLPYIVVVIDEVADLMITVGQEIEQSITRLAQLSRAVGIHMILATQRPSVNVITGTIKANFPGRIAFQVAQKTDSRTILDQQGAESLIGRGDMLFLNPKSGRLIRAQGALVNDSEIIRITDFIRNQGGPAFDLALSNKLEKVQETSPEDEDEPGAASGASASGVDGDDSADEELIQQSIQVIRDTRRASTSSLQRRLRIGYTRAARVMDILEERGIVGPTRGAEPREILIDLDAEMPNNATSGGAPDTKAD
ncbi:MAG: DNA translocase FtsK 4TM domain-containing protein [bacterium]